MTASLAQSILHARTDAKRRSLLRSDPGRRPRPQTCPFRMTKSQFDESAVRLHRRPLLDFVDRGDVTIVTFRRAQLFDDDWQVMRVRDELRRLITETGRRKLVLNFEKAEYINGTGLGLLIGVCRSATNAWGRVALCALSPGILELFAITKLSKVFRIESNVDDAVAWLSEKGLLSRDNKSPLGME